MTIAFEPLTMTSGDVAAVLHATTGRAYETVPTGDMAGRLPALLGHAVADDIGQMLGDLPRLRSLVLEAAGDYVMAVLPRILALATGGADVPSVALVSASLPPLVSLSTGFGTAYGDAAGTLRTVRALALELDGYAAPVLRRLRTRAYEVNPPTSYALLLQSPGFVSISGLGSVQRLLTLSDSAVMDSTITPDFIQALLELFSASDSYTHAAAVLQALADGASLADVAQMIIAADLLDSFIASAVQTDTAQITVLLADGMQAADSTDLLSVILAAISDGFYASLTIATGEDGWTAWVMTTQTKAMRRYTNWAFNSYAVRDEVFLGAGEDGIYRMGGDKDAGAAIRWAIRTGKLNFANGQMKSIPLAYIGVTSRGDILLRVRATTTRGVEVEQTYRMSPSTSADGRERRVKVGQGFRSVYWVFEIANDADGEAAEIHEWHALPVNHTGKLI